MEGELESVLGGESAGAIDESRNGERESRGEVVEKEGEADQLRILKSKRVALVCATHSTNPSQYTTYSGTSSTAS